MSVASKPPYDELAALVVAQSEEFEPVPSLGGQPALVVPEDRGGAVRFFVRAPCVGRRHGAPELPWALVGRQVYVAEASARDHLVA